MSPFLHRAFSRFLLLGGILICLHRSIRVFRAGTTITTGDPPTPPSVSSPLVSNPIDAFIIEKLEQKNLEPSPLAKDSIIVTTIPRSSWLVAQSQENKGLLRK